ncbi:hypothetical protein [Streptomyces sp. NPDC048650]|uniref:hypothetical protein n=1 Tax=unclassified Streptomyces TaxID=2593676 RepID=UPI00371D645C
MTQTQLGSLDLPREPGGPVRATVEGRDGTGRRAVFDLYSISESRPTRAGARQLAAAADRCATGTRVCEQCGARPDLPCTQVDAWLLCQVCAHIEKLRARQRQAAEARARATEQAAELLADGRLAVVHLDYTDRGTTPAGDRRAPSAAHITALDAGGRALLDVHMRLLSPCSQGIPAGATAPEAAVEQIRRVLADRVIVVWSADGLSDLSKALRALDLDWPFPAGYGRRHDLWHLAMDWRGELDPTTGQPRPTIPPDRVDRTLYLLQQIAGPAGHFLGAPSKEGS